MARPSTNARIFGVIMILTQIALAILHGIFIRPVKQASITMQVLVLTNNLLNSSMY
jgi:hypothetical protein